MALPKYTPRDDSVGLTDEENELLDTAVAELGWPKERRLQLVVFLRESEWDEDAAVERARKLEKELAAIGPVPLSAVKPFMTVDETGCPSPCGAVLEDNHGNCARDKQGNPIVIVYGNFECTPQQAIQQMAFLNQRVMKYVAETEIPHITYIYDMQPRSGKHDATASKAWDLQFLRFVNLFPQSFSMYVCGASSAIVSTMNMVHSWLLKNLKASTSYDILDGVVDPTNMLPTWHPQGTFDFKLDEYVSALERES